MIIPKRWIDPSRECVCSIFAGYPDPDCEIHGMDAYYGRYDSYWWGRIRITRPRQPDLRRAA